MGRRPAGRAEGGQVPPLRSLLPNTATELVAVFLHAPLVVAAVPVPVIARGLPLGPA